MKEGDGEEKVRHREAGAHIGKPTRFLFSAGMLEFGTL